MAGTETRYEHIVLDERGIPVLKGTTLKVTVLVVERLAYGWSPEELAFQHPSLTLGQIYSALAYYADHQEELDRDLIERERAVEQLRQAAGSSPLGRKLRAKGTF